MCAVRPLAAAESGGVSTEILLKRIEELEQQVKTLREKFQPDEENAKSQTSPAVSLGASGLQLRSADSNFLMRVGGHLQVDGRWFPDNASATGDTFLIRKARPIIEGALYQKIDFRLMLDFGSGLTAASGNVGFVQDAFVNARLWPELQIQAGKFKEPVGLERLQADVDYLFIERAYPTGLLPNRDVGIQVHGTLWQNALTYAVGAFNGVPDGGSGDIETADDDKDLAARVFAQPFYNVSIESLRRFGFGVAGTYGRHAGPLRGYVSPGQQAIFSYYAGSGANATTIANGSVQRIVPQAYYYYGPFGLLAEYAFSSTEVVRTGGGIASQSARLEHAAWQVAGSWFITGEDNGFKNPIPLHPFNFQGGGWGAWELVARVSGLKLDSQTFPLYADPKNNASEAFSLAGGLNWHMNRNLKISGDYEHTHFQGGSANPLLTRDEDAILARAQITF